jgi:hypothetical protein
MREFLTRSRLRCGLSRVFRTGVGRVNWRNDWIALQERGSHSAPLIGVVGRVFRRNALDGDRRRELELAAVRGVNLPYERKHHRNSWKTRVKEPWHRKAFVIELIAPFHGILLVRAVEVTAELLWDSVVLVNADGVTAGGVPRKRADSYTQKQGQRRRVALLLDVEKLITPFKSAEERTARIRDVSETMMSISNLDGLSPITNSDTNAAPSPTIKEGEGVVLDRDAWGFEGARWRRGGHNKAGARRHAVASVNRYNAQADDTARKWELVGFETLNVDLGAIRRPAIHEVEFVAQGPPRLSALDAREVPDSRGKARLELDGHNGCPLHHRATVRAEREKVTALKPSVKAIGSRHDNRRPFNANAAEDVKGDRHGKP